MLVCERVLDVFWTHQTSKRIFWLNIQHRFFENKKYYFFKLRLSGKNRAYSKEIFWASLWVLKIYLGRRGGLEFTFTPRIVMKQRQREG